MGVKNLELEPESPGIFVAGGVFRARLSFEVEKARAPISIRSLRLRIVGRSEDSEEIFSSSPDLSWHLSYLRNLAGGSSEALTLSAALPPYLPPSSRLVLYSASLSLEVEGDSKLYEIPSCPFIVQGYLDLNSVPGALEPLRLGGTSEMGRLGMGCCARDGGSFELELRLPRSGFCPGDYIRPIGTIQKNSRVRLRELRLFLEQRCRAQQSSEEERVGVVAQDVVPIRLNPGQRRVIQGAALSVPFTPVSPADNSIAYSLRAQVDRHADWTAPLLIGSEPISDTDS